MIKHIYLTLLFYIPLFAFAQKKQNSRVEITSSKGSHVKVDQRAFSIGLINTSQTTQTTIKKKYTLPKYPSNNEVLKFLRASINDSKNDLVDFKYSVAYRNKMSGQCFIKNSESDAIEYIVNTRNQLIIPLDLVALDVIDSFSDLQILRYKGKYGIVNCQGELIGDWQDYYINPFKKNKYTVVTLDDKFGLIDTNGQFIYMPQKYFNSSRYIPSITFNDKEIIFTDIYGLKYKIDCKTMQLDDSVLLNYVTNFRSNEAIQSATVTDSFVIFHTHLGIDFKYDKHKKTFDNIKLFQEIIGYSYDLYSFSKDTNLNYGIDGPFSNNSNIQFTNSTTFIDNNFLFLTRKIIYQHPQSGKKKYDTIYRTCLYSIESASNIATFFSRRMPTWRNVNNENFIYENTFEESFSIDTTDFSNCLSRDVYIDKFNKQIKLFSKTGLVLLDSLPKYLSQTVSGFSKPIIAKYKNGDITILDDRGIELSPFNTMQLSDVKKLKNGYYSYKAFTTYETFDQAKRSTKKYLWGYCSPDFRKVSNPIYCEANDFNDGLAQVSIKKKMLLFNYKRTFLIDTTFNKVQTQKKR